MMPESPLRQIKFFLMNFKVDTEDEVDLADISDLEDNALQTRTGENTTHYYLQNRAREQIMQCTDKDLDMDDSKQ